MRASTRTPALLVGLVLLAGCSPSTDGGPGPTGTTATSPTTASSPTTPSNEPAAPGVRVARTLAEGLDVPWGVAFLPDGSALVAERPTGQVVRVPAGGGEVTPAGTVPEVADQGEGGLLGLAATADGGTVFAYLTSTAGDNRVVRMRYAGGRLGSPTPVVTGIPAADHHNGGLLKLGPDGKLWIGTGDGGQPSRAQDRQSLGGKILRVELDGTAPADNPFAGSPVYSYGHRNVQGLAFDSTGQPWADEFGQNTWDELNRIVPGGNYGWPEVEGKQAHPGFIEPLVQWPTDQASPSGMAIVDDVAYIGGLRGQRLWQVPLEGTRTGTPRAYLTGEFGRIRTVAATAAGQLWITTSNRDGRGSPKPGDDKVILLTLS